MKQRIDRIPVLWRKELPAPITSIRLEGSRPGHARMAVWVNHGLAGTLVMDYDEADQVVSVLDDCVRLRAEIQRYFEVPFEDDIAEQFPAMNGLLRSAREETT